jgi:hypothetical protein
MKIQRRAFAIFATSMVLCAIVLGMGAASASAGAIDNFKSCREAGGSVKACCAGAGGTYTKDDDGTEVCVVVNKNSTVQTPPQTIETTNLNFVRPPTGAVTSIASSDGQSNAGVYGLYQIVVEPDSGCGSIC